MPVVTVTDDDEAATICSSGDATVAPTSCSSASRTCNVTFAGASSGAPAHPDDSSDEDDANHGEGDDANRPDQCLRLIDTNASDDSTGSNHQDSTHITGILHCNDNTSVLRKLTFPHDTNGQRRYGRRDHRSSSDWRNQDGYHHDAGDHQRNDMHSQDATDQRSTEAHTSTREAPPYPGRNKDLDGSRLNHDGVQYDTCTGLVFDSPASCNIGGTHSDEFANSRYLDPHDARHGYQQRFEYDNANERGYHGRNSGRHSDWNNLKYDTGSAYDNNRQRWYQDSGSYGGNDGNYDDGSYNCGRYSGDF